jgi:hypothetical protein
MSQLQYSLEILGFSTIHDATAESLKKAFKTTVLKAHPDKGGRPEDFDQLLSAYVYLLETVHRLHGGRQSLLDVISPEELKESRMDELIHCIFEEFERETFHAEFEKQNPRVDHGYKEWLQDAKYDDKVADGPFGSATQLPPTFPEHTLHDEFVQQAKDGKPEPTALILHPEDMAYYSASVMGTSIMDTKVGCYTSEPFMTPEYTDVYAAFTKENTICDKVSAFVERTQTLEEIIAEREQALLAPLQDAELEVIASYEKKKLQEEQEHLAKVKDYYEHGSASGGGALENWPPSNYPKKDFKGFVVEL